MSLAPDDDRLRRLTRLGRGFTYASSLAEILEYAAEQAADLSRLELSTSGTVPSERSSRRNPHSHCSHAKLGSHGNHGTPNLGEQQRRLASCRYQRFPYRRDRTWRD